MPTYDLCKDFDRVPTGQPRVAKAEGATSLSDHLHLCTKRGKDSSGAQATVVL